MIRRCHIAGVAALTRVLAAASPAEDGAGRVLMVSVTDQRAALYAGTNSPHESVAAWLPAATELEVRGVSDPASEWVLVRPPESLELYIYRDLVKDGRVAVDKSQIRSAPSVTARALFSLNRGERVEVRGVYGDWCRISPPPGMNFWMDRGQLQPFIRMSEEELVADLLKRLHTAFSVPGEVLADTNAPPEAVQSNAPPALPFETYSPR